MILTDFGSTFTKLTIVDVSQKKICHKAAFSSLVKQGSYLQLTQCFETAKELIGERHFDAALKLSSSSAAGGLRMAVVGLSQTLSIAAGRNAAFGAGAKIIGTYIGELDQTAITDIEEKNIEIILFCGGYEGGSVVAVLHNAFKLARSKSQATIVYAGNSRIDKEVRHILRQGQKEVFVVDNIIPDVGRLNTGPSEEIIRKVFMKRIVNMKGLSAVQSKLNMNIIPTPAAVLKAGELLSLGTDKEEGLGPLLIIDIGGATTDIHSYVEQTSCGAHIIGSPEPYAKRTVEGDMGMRESSGTLCEEVGWGKAAESLTCSVETVKNSIERRLEDTTFLPQSDFERDVDHFLASKAACISIARHAGFVRRIYSSVCEALQTGKNLTPVNTAIATGGHLINSLRTKEIIMSLGPGLGKDENMLLPRISRGYIDHHYILYAAGLICQYDPELALRVMKNSLLSI